MEALIPLIVLAVIIVPLGLVIWLIARAVQARDRIEELSRRLSGLEVEVYRLKKTPADARAAWATTSPAAAPAKQPAEEIFERPPAVAPAQSMPPPVVPEPVSYTHLRAH